MPFRFKSNLNKHWFFSCRGQQILSIKPPSKYCGLMDLSHPAPLCYHTMNAARDQHIPKGMTVPVKLYLRKQAVGPQAHGLPTLVLQHIAAGNLPATSKGQTCPKIQPRRRKESWGWLTHVRLKPHYTIWSPESSCAWNHSTPRHFPYISQ